MIDPQLSQRIDAGVERRRDDLCALARRIHAAPELCFEEHRAAGWIAELCRRHGQTVEQPFGDLPTSFCGRIGRGQAHVAILAEYDALPEIGHACGHNLIAAGAVGAFLALADVAGALDGRVSLIGTPAEEGGGGKIKLLQAGAFDGVTAAMMFHPFDRDLVVHPTLAIASLELTFRGKAAHAAVAPHQGRSALTACLDAFRLVDGQRVHFKDGWRVHGFVKHGGEAANIIPERAVCQFSVRAFTVPHLDRLRAVVERCARAAAMASDVDVQIDARQGYRNMISNLPLGRRLFEHLRALGREPAMTDPTVGTGSTDMGDVSHTVPAIHPWLAICDRGQALCHEREFAACAASERGMGAMLCAAKAMARAAAEVLVDAELRAEINAAFRERE